MNAHDEAAATIESREARQRHLTLSIERREAMAAGREARNQALRDEAVRVVATYREHLRYDAAQNESNGYVSWANVTIPTDWQFRVARGDA